MSKEFLYLIIIISLTSILLIKNFIVQIMKTQEENKGNSKELRKSISKEDAKYENENIIMKKINRSTPNQPNLKTLYFKDELEILHEDHDD